MKQTVFVLIYEHADLVWRRCFAKDFEYEGQNFVSYAKLEAYYILENIRLCDKYDFYKFTVESVAMLRKFLEDHPEYEEKVETLVKSGRLYIPFSGDNIVDSNMVEGESIVRNYLYGHNYLKEKYGVEPQQVTRNDAFGNSAQLPQIIRKFGRKWVTNLTYNKCDNLYWKGLDGSTVLNYEPKMLASCGGWSKYRPCPACKGYEGEDCPECNNLRIDIAHTEAMRVKPGKLSEYDGAIPGYIYCGGEEILPTEDVVTWVLEHKDEYDFRFIGFDEYLPYIQEMLDRVDEVKDDELHSSCEVNVNNSGCFVTRIETKQVVRKNEQEILAAETLQLLKCLKDGSYPTENFRKLWENMFFTIFHDSITATHIDAAKEEIMEASRAVSNEAVRLQTDALLTLSQDEKGCVTIYNPYGQTVSADAVVTLSSDEDVCLLDGEGNRAPIKEFQRDGDVVTLTVFVKDLGAFSARKYQVVQEVYQSEKVTLCEIDEFRGAPILTNDVEDAIATDEKGEQTVIENEYFRITAETSGVVEIFDKTLGKVISEKGKYGVCEWVLEHDEGSPWATHSVDMHRIPLGKSTHLVSVEKTADMQKLNFYVCPHDVEANSVMGLRIHYSVMLLAGCDMVKFSADVFWHTQSYRLRIAVPTLGEAKHFYEIPYGVLERNPYEPNIMRPDGSINWASAAGDYPAIHWAGTQNEDYSLAVFNKGTPSYQVDDDSVIYLSVLRSPSLGSYLYSPREYTMTAYDGMRDSGDHHFEYAIKAYREGFDKNSAVTDGVSYQAKLVTSEGIFEPCALPTLSAEDARISSVKRSEDGRGIIVRICEYHGKAANGVLHLPKELSVSGAWITDLKEDTESALTIANGEIPLFIKPYEILTVYLKLL